MALPVYNQINNLRLYELKTENLSACWAGYLPSKNSNFGKTLTLSVTWNDEGGVYLFLKEKPTDFNLFFNNLNQFLPLISNGEVRILWIYNPNYPNSTFWQSNTVKAFATRTANRTNWFVRRPALFSIGNYTLAIEENTVMNLEDEFNSSISFQVEGVKFFGSNKVYPTKGYAVTIPCWGQNAGAWQSYLDLDNNDFSKLGLRIRYATTSPLDNKKNPYGETESIDAEIFASDTIVPFQMLLSLDILNPIDPNRSYLDFFPYPTSSPSSIKSSFITKNGYSIYLTPKSSGVNHSPARLVFNSMPNRNVNANVNAYSNYYLTPNGAFSLKADYPSSLKISTEFLCGLSGVEYIEFSDEDLLVFYSGKPAGVDIQVLDETTQKITFLISNSTAYTTSWATILPQQSSVCKYFSEANDAPFFNNTSDDLKSLEYYPLSLLNLPNVNDKIPDSSFFPLFPYSGVKKSQKGIASKSSYINSLEYHVMNPARQSVIEKIGIAASIKTNSASPIIYALTPQGYQAIFNNGKWTGINIASSVVDGTKDGKTVVVSKVDVKFVSGDQNTALPDALQKAFLTNQQFLVMSANLNGNLDCFKASIMLSDWSFGSPTGEGILMPKTTTTGDYKNVIIFKSGSSTIKEMVGNPQLWTQYEEFNDSNADPDGKFLSNWLVNYLADAEKIYDDGNGDTSFENFCTLINNKDWNGFLILRVEVGDISTLPVDVQAITADISGGLFAHHLGNEINHVDSQAGTDTSYIINSPSFGLIHYINPNFATQINNLPPYVQISDDYNFTVLTLEVSFVKNLEKSFSNKSMLLINKFLGDTVLQTGPNGERSANNVILIGTYHDVDNVPTYSFSTAPGTITNFYLASNAINYNSISNVTMNVVKDDASTVSDEIYHASFSIRGSLNFIGDTNFDILSYDYLSYYGVSMDVKIERTTTGTYPNETINVTNTYSLDTSKLSFELNPIQILDPSDTAQGFNVVRSGSLVSQFPVKLNKLVDYTTSFDSTNKPNNASPSDLGYRLLDTFTPQGISFSSPENGEAWYGLEFDLSLGGKGSLASSSVISASFILAWTPGGIGGFANASPQFKLSGPGGVSLSFDFEGVLKFGAKDILLNRYIGKKLTDLSYFYLEFQSIVLSLLGISFPPGGTTNIVLMGDTSAGVGSIINPTLSWFGGYAKKKQG